MGKAIKLALLKVAQLENVEINWQEVKMHTNATTFLVLMQVQKGSESLNIKREESFRKVQILRQQISLDVKQVHWVKA